MPIEFREVRRGEIDDALAFAAEQGATVSAPAVRHQLSLLAINAEKAVLGSAIHEVADDGRRHIHVHLKPDTHPGLGRLLIDRALRKAEAADLATTHVAIHHEAADGSTWDDANWLARLRPAQANEDPAPAEGKAASSQDESAEASPVGEAEAA